MGNIYSHWRQIGNILFASFFIFIFIFSLTSCYSKLPDESTGQNLFTSLIKNESEELLSLVSFHKTNGISHSIDGASAYTLHYAAVIQFLDKGMWTYGAINEKWNGSFSASKGWPSFDDNLNILTKSLPGSKGDRINLEGEIQFVDTDNGWIPRNITGDIGDFKNPDYLTYIKSIVAYQTQRKKALIDLSTITVALEGYHWNNYEYPSDSLGLEILKKKINSDENPYAIYANESYLSYLPADPWGSEYQYNVSNDHKTYSLFSLGSDKKPGGGGAKIDIYAPQMKN